MSSSQIEINETTKTTELTELKEEYPDANETNIIQTIIKLMEQVDDFVDMSGFEKKVHVLAGIKEILGEKIYRQYYYFISEFIDFTISISRNKLKLNLNKYKKHFCCF
tara:strand:+ start:661 stop:984 length:324 start_codon:yes stop_codon:yes gene_type:complete